jgi:hypothetical protein
VYEGELPDTALAAPAMGVVGVAVGIDVLVMLVLVSVVVSVLLVRYTRLA